MRLFGTIRIFETLEEGYKKNTKFLFVFYVDTQKRIMQIVCRANRARKEDQTWYFVSRIVRSLEQII